METRKLNVKFHQNIAKLFYAIAKSDHVINANEIKTLKTVVKEKWLMIDETFDIFGTDSAYQIEVVFDWLHSKEATAEDSYNDFIEYYHNHNYLFNSEVKKLILETSNQIANAFGEKNKSEVLNKYNIESLFHHLL